MSGQPSAFSGQQGKETTQIYSRARKVLFLDFSAPGRFFHSTHRRQHFSNALPPLPSISLGTRYFLLGTFFYSALLVLILALAACDFIGADVPLALTPTRTLSAPTVEPSPTVSMHSAEELAAGLTLGQNDLTAAAAPSGGALPPLELSPQPGSAAHRIQIPAGDATLMFGDLYFTGDARVPGILMLGKDTAAWGDFPTRLQDAGFTVMVMPVRQPPSTDDFRRIMQAFGEAGTVNPGSIGVVGAEEGADLALIGCAVEPLCDTAVLLTPLAGDTLLNIIADYNPRPLLVAASQTDPVSLATAQALQGLAKGEMLLQPFTDAGRGTAMLQNRPDLGDLIIAWLQRQLIR